MRDLTEHEARRDALRRVMQAGRVTRADAAALMRVSLASLNTWMLPGASKHARTAPVGAIELLAFKLGEPLPDLGADAAGCERPAAPK